LEAAEVIGRFQQTPFWRIFDGVPTRLSNRSVPMYCLRQNRFHRDLQLLVVCMYTEQEEAG
jgi:hypothetical protein